MLIIYQLVYVELVFIYKRNPVFLQVRNWGPEFELGTIKEPILDIILDKDLFI